MTHVPVLFDEVMSWIGPRSGGKYIDGTLGYGGHSGGILQLSSPDGRVLAFDRDADAIELTRSRLAEYGDRILIVHGSYADMGSIAPEHGFDEVDGILLDLGLSSLQLDSAERGFSFRFDGPLDMRFDRSGGESAEDLINNLDESELADMLWTYGEEHDSRRIARRIVERRPIRTTAQLAEIVAGAKRRGSRKINPATQTFQALRIAVNDELGALERGLTAAIGLLKPGGTLAVISFHSLEDRYVKQTFRALSRECICPPGQPVCTCDTKPVLSLPQRKAIQASATEVASNPRSRSARLRIARKVET